jgi:hypothetical protein
VTGYDELDTRIAKTRANVETAKKLGVSFYTYIQERISGAYQMRSLAHLIAERVQPLNLGASFADTS